jgi:hypothetical protein
MSELHTSLVQQEMEESGEMDFIRQHTAAARGEQAPTPVEQADTVDVPEGTLDDGGEGADLAPEPEVEGQSDGQEEGQLSSEQEDVLYLDLDDSTQALIDEKYGGDINKALQALPNAQSTIGRQGSELGDLRKQLEEFQAEIRQTVAQSQPYPEWPDEYAEPSDAAAQFREISEAAFHRGDVQTFQGAIAAWEEVDRVSVANYRDLKEMQIAQRQAAQTQVAPVQDDEATLVAGADAIRAKYPQFHDDEFKAAVAAELDKTPSLKAVLWQGVPGVSPQERLNVLEEAAQRVIARTTSETVTQARRRIAVRTSEEARAARAEAQVSRGTTAGGTDGEPEARTIPMGESGRVLNLDRLNAMLSPEDRV